MATFKVIYNTQISIAALVDIPDDEIADDFDDGTVDDAAREAVTEYLSTLTRQVHGGVRVWADAEIDGIAADEITRTDEHGNPMPDEDEPICGESFDHDLRVIDQRDGGTTYECRTCGAEICEYDEEG